MSISTGVLDKFKSPVRNLFSVQLFFLRLYGYMDPELNNYFPSWKLFGKIIGWTYRIASVCILVQLAVFLLFSTLEYIESGLFEDKIDSLSMFMVYSYATFVSIYFNLNSKVLYDFFTVVNKEYRHHSLLGHTVVSYEKSYEVASKLTRYWQPFGTICVTFCSLIPIIIQQRILPVKCLYPFDMEDDFVYNIVYAIQFLAQLAMAGAYANGVTLYVSAILIMLGQYDILFCSLKNVQTHSALLAGGDIQNEEHDEDDELNQYAICNEEKVDLSNFASGNNSLPPTGLQAALRHSMKSCVIHHHFILRSCEKLEKLFNPHCLINFLQITIQLCLIVFLVVFGNQSIFSSIISIGYVSLTLGELFMFTYFGELLRLHSVRGGEALLRSPWYKNTTVIKRDILILLINSKKPVELTAGKMFVMNIDRFRLVIAQAFSFLTLLQKMTAKNV